MKNSTEILWGHRRPVWVTFSVSRSDKAQAILSVADALRWASLQRFWYVCQKRVAAHSAQGAWRHAQGATSDTRVACGPSSGPGRGARSWSGQAWKPRHLEKPWDFSEPQAEPCMFNRHTFSRKHFDRDVTDLWPCLGSHAFHVFREPLRSMS